MVVLGCKLPGSLSGSDNTANTPANHAAPETGSGAAVATNDPLADLKAASKRFNEVKAFQATMDGSGKNEMHMQVSFAAPDRYHLKNAGMESIIIGKNTYMRINGTWKKFPLDLGSAIPSMRDAFTEEGLKTISDVQYVGDENVNGKDSLVYRYKGSGLKGGSAYTSRLWIARDDGLPQKIEVEYDGGPLKQMSTNYEYKDVPIDAPVDN
jgi:hypothetical protein